MLKVFKKRPSKADKEQEKEKEIQAELDKILKQSKRFQELLESMKKKHLEELTKEAHALAEGMEEEAALYRDNADCIQKQILAYAKKVSALDKSYNDLEEFFANKMADEEIENIQNNLTRKKNKLGIAETGRIHRIAFVVQQYFTRDGYY